MATEDFLIACIREWSHGNYLVAMSCVCSAVDAAAAEEFPESKNKNRERMCKFIDRYLDIITGVGFGGAILAKPGGSLCMPNPAKPGTNEDIKVIIYKSLRCFLVHRASLPANAEFTERAFYGHEKGVLKIPTRLIAALMLAVTGSPTNAGMRIGDSYQLVLDGKVVPLNSLAGDSTKVKQYLGLPQ